MNWTPPLEEPEIQTHSVDAITDSSGRIQDDIFFLSQGLEPPIVPHSEEPQTPPPEAELDEFREDSLSQGLEPPQDVPPPEEPTQRRLPRPLSPAELEENPDSSGTVDFNAIFLSQGLEPPSLLQSVPPPPKDLSDYPPVSHERVKRLLTNEQRAALRRTQIRMKETRPAELNVPPLSHEDLRRVRRFPSKEERAARRRTRKRMTQYNTTTQTLPRPLSRAELNVPPPQDVHPPAKLQRLPRPLSRAELEEFRDSSGRVDFNAIFLSQGLESVPPPPEPPSLLQNVPPPTRRLPRLLSQAELEELRDRSGRIVFNAIVLSQGLEPPQVVPPPEEPQRLPRPLSQAELEENRGDSLGRIDFNAIVLSQGLEPPTLLQSVPPPREDLTGDFSLDEEVVVERVKRLPTNEQRAALRRGEIRMKMVRPPEAPETPIRFLTRAQLDAFTDSSGQTDYDAYLLGHQSKGLSEETISKYLKTMNADEIRAHGKDGDRKICAVCLDDVCGQTDFVSILDDCGHKFHYFCLKKWLRRKNTCPRCGRTAIFLLGDGW